MKNFFPSKIQALMIKFLVIFVCSLHSNYAFKFSPMSSSLNPAEKKSSVFSIENDTKSPVAIQLSVAKRTMDLFGNEANEFDIKHLQVFPDQLIVPPGEKRSVKVSYLKTDTPSTEEAYRVIAEQVPVDLDKDSSKKANIKVLLRYIASFYVTPTKPFSKVELLKYEFDSKDKVWNFTVKNDGTKHQVLTNLTLHFRDKGEMKTIHQDSLVGFAGENILASSQRVFKVASSEALTSIPKQAKVLLKFDDDNEL